MELSLVTETNLCIFHIGIAVIYVVFPTVLHGGSFFTLNVVMKLYFLQDEQKHTNTLMLGDFVFEVYEHEIEIY